jgi:hypothetical protein
MQAYDFDPSSFDRLLQEETQPQTMRGFLADLLTPPWMWAKDGPDRVKDLLMLFKEDAKFKMLFALNSPLTRADAEVLPKVWRLDPVGSETAIVARCTAGHLDTILATSNGLLLDKYLNIGWYFPKPNSFEAGSGADNDWFGGYAQLLERWRAVASYCVESGLTDLLSVTHDKDSLVHYHIPQQ